MKLIVVLVDAGLYLGLSMICISILIFIRMILAVPSGFAKAIFDDIKRGYEQDTKFGGGIGIAYKLLYMGMGLCLAFGLLKLIMYIVSS